MPPLTPAGKRGGVRMGMSKKPVCFQSAAAGIRPPAQPHDYALAERKPNNGTRRASTLALARLMKIYPSFMRLRHKGNAKHKPV